MIQGHQTFLNTKMIQNKTLDYHVSYEKRKKDETQRKFFLAVRTNHKHHYSCKKRNSDMLVFLLNKQFIHIPFFTFLQCCMQDATLFSDFLDTPGQGREIRNTNVSIAFSTSLQLRLGCNIGFQTSQNQSKRQIWNILCLY